MSQIGLMAAGIVDIGLLTIVHISSSSDWCLIMLHQLCRMVTLDCKKLTVVEPCRSSHLVHNRVNEFCFMQEQKYAYGEHTKIRFLQQ